MLANEKHRANIEKAFSEYLESSYFFGHVYPGQFYDFCRNYEAYRNINNTLCNRVQLSVQELAMRTNTSFRKTGPHKGTLQRAKYYLAIGLESIAEGDNINRRLREKLGDGYGDFGKYVPLHTVKYLYEIGFSVEDLPPLARDDVKNFLKKMQDEQYTKVSDYIAHMRNVVIPLEQRETTESDEPGFLYCFISNLAAQTKGFCVVKVGLSICTLMAPPICG